jgi:hypothetical protein
MEEALLDIAAETAVATDAMTRASTTDVSAFAKHRAEMNAYVRLRWTSHYSPSMTAPELRLQKEGDDR